MDNVDSGTSSEPLVAPFDLALVWPLRLDSSSMATKVRQAVASALTGAGWIRIENLVRRAGRPEEDGFAYAEMASFHPFVQSFLYGKRNVSTHARPTAHHFDL